LYEHGRTAVGTEFEPGGGRALMGGGDLPRAGRRVDDANSRLLMAHPSSVATARQMVRDVLTGARREDLVETAQLLVSEVVTNALVHAGTPIDFHASVGDAGLRVEVTDGSTQAPAPRSYAAMAGTGRGLRLLQQLVDRWGTHARPDGKTVWFELDSGNRLDEMVSSPTPDALDAGASPGAPGEDVVDVVLLNTPLLLHAAWQEHAEGLLREYLLVKLDTEDPTEALEAHAAASDAISLLHEHLPRPRLGENPEELMAHAVEPGVSSRREVLPVPRTSVPHFRVLDQAMDSAIALADSGAFLTPPIQPELRELRRWLCQQVSRQVNGEPPSTWTSDPSAAPAVAVPPISWEDEMANLEGEALIASDDTDRIVGVSRDACELLGYPGPGELLGRRLVAIIPARYHQAHLAGFTLHLSNGRSPLLGRAVVVPVLRSDGTEIAVELLVESRRQQPDRHLFVARMRPAPA
jgi:PAS domain S-box-containing protein